MPSTVNGSQSTPAAKPELVEAAPRRAEAENAFFEFAGAELTLAYMLAAYTAQREGDLLVTAWQQVRGDRIAPTSKDLDLARGAAPSGFERSPERCRAAGHHDPHDAQRSPLEYQVVSAQLEACDDPGGR
jgi:hypothetical protein